MNQEKSCGCIIIKNDKVLVISTEDDQGTIFWSFPKGHQEPGETDQQTALRETKEEIGLNVTIIDDRPIATSHPVKHHTATKTINFFLATPTSASSNLRLQEEEVVGARWMTFAEADQHLHGKYSYYGAAWDEAKRRMEKHDA